MWKASSILAAGLFLAGCATPNGYNPLTGQSTQPGTYSIELDDTGALIESATLKGGPVVKWSKSPDGTVELMINHNQELIIDGLLEVLR